MRRRNIDIDLEFDALDNRFMGMFRFISSSMGRLRNYIGDERKSLRNYLIIMLISTILLTFVPIIVGIYIDRVIGEWTVGNPDVSYILDMALIIILVITIWYASNTHASKGLVKLGMAVTRRMRSEINRKVQKLPMSYVDSHPAGRMTALLTNDISFVYNLLSTDLIGALAYISTSAIIVVLMIITNIWMGIFFAALVPASVLVAQWVGKRAGHHFVREKKTVATLNGQVLDTLSNHRLAKTFLLEDTLLEKYDRVNEAHRVSFTWSRLFSGLIEPSVTVISNIGYVAAAAMGALLMMNGMLSQGLFVAFIFYVRAVSKPMVSSSASINNIHTEMVSLNRILDFLEEKEIEDEGSKDPFLIDNVKGEICFEDVTFSYDGERDVLHDVSFKVECGSVVALIGPTGSGKSTIANLLLKFYEPKSGRITLDDRDIASIRTEDLMGAYGTILQLPWMFSGTFRENICFGDDIPEDRMVEAARTTGLDNFVRKLPNGYDALIGEGGHTLSQMEMKLLCMTRVLLSDPKVLVLDEATSGLDPSTEMHIIRSLRQVMAGRTVIMTTHNMRLASKADKIIVMDSGRVLEAGSHDELMAKSGRYCDLYLMSM